MWGWWPAAPSPGPYCCILTRVEAHRGQGVSPRAPVGQESWRSQLCEAGVCKPKTHVHKPQAWPVGWTL